MKRTRANTACTGQVLAFVHTFREAARALFCLPNFYRPCLVGKDNAEAVDLPERYKKV